MLVIACADKFTLVTDLSTGETEQYFVPDGTPAASPFGLIRASNGRCYFDHGSMFMEFDPASREYTFSQNVPGAADFMGFTEASDGTIWAGTYPDCQLVSFNPHTRELKTHGRMDPAEKYPSFLCVDDEGWVYIGIGTARANIVAYNPTTGERRQLLKEEDRPAGAGYVRRDTDGKASGYAGPLWFRLWNGELTPCKQSEIGTKAFVGDIHWQATSYPLSDGRMVSEYNMPERYMKIKDPKSGEEFTIEFDYETQGAEITSIATGPEGRIYGSSCHPMHFFMYNPAENDLQDWGTVPDIGGGNFCAIAAQGDYVIGAEYAGGRMYAYDTTRSWAPYAEGETQNPVMLGQWKQDICRPRTALAMPDGKTVMMGGFAGYGLCGGGIGVVDLETSETELLTADKDLLAGHSTITLKAIDGNTLVGGTSMLAPGGGHTTATEAELYIMDWPSRKIVWHQAVVPGVQNINSIEVGIDGLVYGLADNSIFFVFDPQSREILHTEDFSAYGGVPRHAFQKAPDGTLYAIMSKAIVRIPSGIFGMKHEKIADTPVTVQAGGAYLNDALYFGSGSHLWSYEIPK